MHPPRLGGLCYEFPRLVNRLTVRFVCVLDSLGVGDEMVKDRDFLLPLITTRLPCHGPELRDQVVVDDQNMRVAVAGEIPVGGPHRPAGVDSVREVVTLLGANGAEGGTIPPGGRWDDRGDQEDTG